MSTSSVLFLESMNSTSNQHVLLCTKLIVGVEKNPPCAGSFLYTATPAAAPPLAPERVRARASHVYFGIFSTLLPCAIQVV